jgi:uncharacterized membrane protein
MDWAHLHLMTNHLPVVGMIIGLVIFAVSLAWKSADLRKFSLYYFVVLGAASLVVFLTGEPAEELIERTRSVSEAAIERHEEASVIGLLAIEAVAVLSFAGIFFRKAEVASRAWFTRSLLALSLIASGVIGWVANLGGQIEHGQSQAAGTVAGEED